MSRLRASVIVLPAGVWRIAFSIRFASAWVRSSRSTWIVTLLRDLRLYMLASVFRRRCKGFHHRFAQLAEIEVGEAGSPRSRFDLSDPQ